MISTYVRKAYALVGAVRTGKDSVANFLIETRGFRQMAFADQIKEEFGISKEDFEASKIAGNIEELRKKLWEFSAAKKKEDPLYFINKVIDKAKSYTDNLIITDIRTEEELASFQSMEFGRHHRVKKVFWVRGDFEKEIDEKERLNGSKLFRWQIANYDPYPGIIYNDKNGLYAFYQELDKFFFAEDIEDIWNDPALNLNIRSYLNQFEIKLKESRVYDETKSIAGHRRGDSKLLSGIRSLLK